MNIDKQTELSVDLQIGPTSLGMVRLFLKTNNLEIPMDFSPEEAEEIAEELKSAAQKARDLDLC
tara:strand:+ start:954 stop:1145 length:192 start_codon:yes stop_codon:yes gene_type:complete